MAKTCMRTAFYSLGMLILFLLAMVPSLAAGSPRWLYWHIDHFDAPLPLRLYQPFHGETVRNWEGYGIYFEKADVNLRRLPMGRGKSALQISYNLPPLFSWGNWFTIRREFESAIDLHEYAGLAIQVQAESVANTRFRLTLTDVATANDVAKHGADEMWWYDAPPDFLATHWGESRTLYAPFAEFYRSYGEGARINDSKLDLSKIAAFEINLVSSGTNPGKGVIAVDCLRAYKRKSSRTRELVQRHRRST
ncbi:MAG TPA: hypothetical protein VIA62_09705 [Thermoanaerobaculia bacterium]|jgi:hypothetical protein|nr:hypothetical protein [Thermoanaerobaculia bacterium]